MSVGCLRAHVRDFLLLVIFGGGLWSRHEPLCGGVLDCSMDLCLKVRLMA